MGGLAPGASSGSSVLRSTTSGRWESGEGWQPGYSALLNSAAAKPVQEACLHHSIPTMFWHSDPEHCKALDCLFLCWTEAFLCDRCNRATAGRMCWQVSCTCTLAAGRGWQRSWSSAAQPSICSPSGRRLPLPRKPPARAASALMPCVPAAATAARTCPPRAARTSPEPPAPSSRCDPPSTCFVCLAFVCPLIWGPLGVIAF